MLKRNWLIIILIVITFGVAIFGASVLFTKGLISADIFTGMALLLSVLIALITYRWTRNNELLILSEKKRDDFIKEPSFKRIRMLIEHNDIELQTVIAILNISNPYEPKTLPIKYWELHEEFDKYLNYLEGLAILYKHKNIFKESLEGLWSYYSKRLRKVHTIDFTKRQPKMAEMEECINSIYEGSIPKEIKDAWEKCKSGGYEGIEDPIKKDAKNKEKKEYINPIERPIWYYINYGPYALTPLKELIKDLYQHESEKNNLSLENDGIKGEEDDTRGEEKATGGSQVMRTGWLRWVKGGAKYYIWAFGIMLAHLAVLSQIIAFPDSQSQLKLLILLYIFDAAWIIALVLDIYQQNRRRQ